jgi:hypothetical protein
MSSISGSLRFGRDLQTSRKRMRWDTRNRWWVVRRLPLELAEWVRPPRPRRAHTREVRRDTLVEENGWTNPRFFPPRRRGWSTSYPRQTRCPEFHRRGSHPTPPDPQTPFMQLLSSTPRLYCLAASPSGVSPSPHRPRLPRRPLRASPSPSHPPSGPFLLPCRPAPSPR